jgi:hypothetical protein
VEELVRDADFVTSSDAVRVEFGIRFGKSLPVFNVTGIPFGD